MVSRIVNIIEILEVSREEATPPKLVLADKIEVLNEPST